MGITTLMFNKILFIVSLLSCSDCFAMEYVDDVEVQRASILALFTEAGKASSLVDYSMQRSAVEVFTKEEISIFLSVQERFCSPSGSVSDMEEQAAFELGQILTDSEVVKAISAAQERIMTAQERTRAASKK